MLCGVAKAVRTCSIYLSITPPLCMQSGRYSLSGIHTAALLKHAVVGRGLHHADYEGVGGLSSLCGACLHTIKHLSADYAETVNDTQARVTFQTGCRAYRMVALYEAAGRSFFHIDFLFL